MQSIPTTSLDERVTPEGDVLLTLWTESAIETEKLVEALRQCKERYGAQKLLIHGKFIQLVPPSSMQVTHLREDYASGLLPYIKRITKSENRAVYLD